VGSRARPLGARGVRAGVGGLVAYPPSWPTQAAAYLTGCLEILAIRGRHLARTGRSGVDALRAFHDALARSGGLPLPLAERALVNSVSGGGS
jgi:uncharacterized protein (DUF885 family)